MVKPVNHISLDGNLGVQLQSNYISFWYPGLPKDVHFTIAFNENAAEVNLHVTKNNGSTFSKPKNTILVISKTELDDDKLKLVVSALLQRMLIPVKPIKFESKRGKKILMISMPNGDAQLECKFNVSFKKVASTRGRRMRIANIASIENELKTCLHAKNISKYVKTFNGYPPPLAEHVMLYTKKRIMSLIKINHTWYTFRKNTNLFDLLVSLTGTELAKQIKYKGIKAISIVKSANSFDEIKHLNCPIRLFIKSAAQILL